MTLIIGVRCSDGIVVGADGAATFGPLGHQTIVQPVKKLTKVAGSMIFGVSGPVGLSQRIGAVLDEQWTTKKLSGKNSAQAMQILRNAMAPDLIGEIKYAAEAVKLLGGIAQQPAISYSVLAIPIDKRPRLYQFDYTGAPEEATVDLPFVAVGSGQTLADPFLAFLREIFWKSAEPTLSQGVFAVVWSLTHAIRTSPGGVAEPIQLMTLSASPGGYTIKEFEKEELEETKQAINAAEAYLKKFKEAPTEPPPSPSPPSTHS